MTDERAVNLLDAILHEIAFGLVHRAYPDRPEDRHIHIGRRIGLGHIHRNAEFILKSLFAVQHQAEYADRTGQRHRRSQNDIRRTRNVVPARSGHVSHRHDDRLELTDLFHFMPDHFRRQRASSRTVDPQHNRFHLVVRSYPGQPRRQRTAADQPFPALSVHDLPFGIHDGDLIPG